MLPAFRSFVRDWVFEGILCKFLFPLPTAIVLNWQAQHARCGVQILHWIPLVTSVKYSSAAFIETTSFG